MGTTDSRKSRLLAPVQEIRSRGFQLFGEQPTVPQPQPGEQFQVGDPLLSSLSDTTGRPHTVGRYTCLQTYSVALLVARRINDRKVAGSRSTKVVCSTVLTGELPAVAGRHSFFRAVGSWSLDCQR